MKKICSIGLIFIMMILFSFNSIVLAATITIGIDKRPTVNKTKTIIKNSGIVNIACFGLDGGNIKKYSRSDSIMVVSIDKKKNKIKVTSFMRDMYVQVPGKGKDKINAAYAYGGPNLAIKTLNSNFGLEISDYVVIDYKGLEKLIDSLGGVNIKINADEAKRLNTYFSDGGNLSDKKTNKLVKGMTTLSGKIAVQYCRIRKIGNGDYERTSRQRRVVEQIIQRVKKNGIAKLPKLVSSLIPYTKTSLSLIELVKLATIGLTLKTNTLEQFRIPVDGTFKSQTLKGIWIIVPNLEENKTKLFKFIYG